MGAIMSDNVVIDVLGYYDNKVNIDIVEEAHYVHGILGSPENTKRFRLKITFVNHTGNTVLYGEWKYSIHEANTQLVHISTLFGEKGFYINAARNENNNDE